MPSAIRQSPSSRRNFEEGGNQVECAKRARAPAPGARASKPRTRSSKTSNARSRVRARSRSCLDASTAAAARRIGRERVCAPTSSWYGATDHEREPSSAWDLRTVTAEARISACAAAGREGEDVPKEVFRAPSPASSPSATSLGAVRICEPSVDKPWSSTAMRAMAADAGADERADDCPSAASGSSASSSLAAPRLSSLPSLSSLP